LDLSPDRLAYEQQMKTRTAKQDQSADTAPVFLIFSLRIGATVFSSQSPANVCAAKDKEDKISILQLPYFS
jgi:hypothetical protein